MDTVNRDLIECGSASFTHAGERESGDSFIIAPFSDGLLVAVIDGLGHGSEAALAGRLAAEVLREHAGESPVQLVRRCHEKLISTRGAVINLSSFDGRENTLTFLGIGNIECILVRPGRGSTRILMTRSGVVGFSLPSLRAETIPIRRGDLIIQVTDGVRIGFDEGLPVEAPAQVIADHIIDGFARHNDDALAFVARYRGALI